MADDHFTAETEGKVGTILTPEDARKAHHLATADPERDGLLTGPAHEEKYGLERAEVSAELWRGVGVHPTENRALVEGEDGAENLRGAALETTAAPAATERTAAPRAKK
ncbi:MAG: hypothetical protein ACXV5Q_01345 [Frankiaceae bacterium]